MGKLCGKVAVVTGGSKGIGASIAEHLAGEGASVVVNYANSKAGAEAVVARIKDKGGNAIAVQGDVGRPEDIKRPFAETRRNHGKVDILVNNAGTYEFASVEAITPEHIQKHFTLNVAAVLLATQAAVNLMAPNGGSIINIGSIVGRRVTQAWRPRVIEPSYRAPAELSLFLHTRTSSIHVLKILIRSISFR